MNDNFEKMLSKKLKQNDSKLWENNWILNSLVNILRFRMFIRIRLYNLGSFIRNLMGK